MQDFVQEMSEKDEKINSLVDNGPLKLKLICVLQDVVSVLLKFLP